jgi:hypothetical protein
MNKINSKGQFIKNHIPWNKGMKVVSNTGRTHFKKGQIPWNKGKPYIKIRGKNHYRWKGGFWIDKDGYKVIDIKRGKKKIRYFEHRKIMEDHVGRKLNPNEDVHHVDGNKLNNSIKNLLLLGKSEHTKIHYLQKGGGVQFNP